VSIVEKAIRKLQTERRAEIAERPDVPHVIGSVVERGDAPAPDRSLARPVLPVRPSRIVHVDRDTLRQAGMLPPESEEHELADQYRVIKRPLIRHAFEPGPDAVAPQLIMMASALPGDGKTFTCINLALSMSLETDRSVLLVDADVAKPHVSRMFGVEDEPGLLDVLTDPARSVESVILPTDVPRLRILPAGKRQETATELLASDRNREVAKRLCELDPRGIVLFDSSPILLTSESRVLASLVGQIVLVVKAGLTPQHAVKDTIEILGSGKRVYLVLNQADLSGPLSYYYGYRYGHKQGPRQDAPP
jgi:protein-tyrosine kinase